MTRRQVRAYVRENTRRITDPVAKRRQMESLTNYIYYCEKKKIRWQVPPAKI